MKKTLLLTFIIIMLIASVLLSSCVSAPPHLTYPETDARYEGTLTVRSNESRFGVSLELSEQGSVMTITFDSPEEMRAYTYVRDGDGIRLITDGLEMPASADGTAARLFAMFDNRDPDIADFLPDKVDGVKIVKVIFTDGSSATVRASDGMPVMLESEYLIFEISG